MPLSVTFSEPFYTGGSTSSEVPSRYDCALDGRPYMIDTAAGTFMHQTVPLLRAQADQAASPSEASINPDDLWRRSMDTWHQGAGQTYLDRDDSEPARFHTSKGVDVWTKWELSLLPDTDQKRASANTNLGLAVAGSRLYAIDGGSLLYATDVTGDTPTFTTVTGLTPSPTVLDSSISGTDASSAVSASVSPVANALLLCAVESSHGAAATLPTVTGLGLTWVQVATILQGSSLNRLTVFRAMGSTTPTPGAVTIDFGGVTQTGISYSITQWTGVDITGTNGSGAVVQAPTNKDDTGAALSLTVTAAAFGSTRNATWGVFRIDNTGNRTLGTGFTSLVNGTHASPNARFSSEWTASNDTSVDMTFASAGSILGIAIEIKAAAAIAPTSIATDGTNVWVAAGASGVLTTTSTASAATTYNTGTVNVVGYVKGRLMAATGNVLYNIIASGALPAALLTHPNTGFTWVGFAEGPSVIYAAGYSGDKSLIYKTAIKADGTTLDVPTVAGELPDGEIVRSVQGYLGFLCIGTDLGVRFAAPDDNGNLTIGSLIPTTSAVLTFEPQDRYVWFGLTNYDTSSTGLGRMDLTTLTGPLTPAYASDLMVTGQGAVLAAATFQTLRVLAVSGLGFYAETTTLVSSGTIDSGQITYKLPDEKVGLYVDVHHDLVGTHAVSVSVDGGAFVSLGSHDAADTPFVVGELRGSRHEVRLTLSTLAGTGPTIRSWTLRSYPTAATVLIIIVPLILAEWIDLHNGTTAPCDPAAELAAMDALRRNRSLVQWQEGDTTYSVTVEDYQWQPTHRTKDNTAWNGTLTPKLKAITA